jgi:hypothetical protein
MIKLTNILLENRLEEDYPTNWNADEFAKLSSFNQRVQYAEKNLQRISSGSSRIVYKIDDTKVLKLAKNKRGIAQNEVEIDFSNDYMWDGLVAEIFNHNPLGLWVEMELATKLTPSIFKQITGLDFKAYGESLRYYEQEQTSRGKIRMSKPESYDEMWENEFGSDIFNLVGSYDIPVGDLTRLSTYGVVNRDGSPKVVMIDYGLNRDVYDGFYK